MTAYLTQPGTGCKMMKGLHLAQYPNGLCAGLVGTRIFSPQSALSRSIRLHSYAMITGFNTDVDYKGVVFHVQTEDKGLENPVIESLIYKGGEILGSRRIPYSEMMKSGYDEKAVVKLMEDQHQTMIQEIRQGRFDESTDILLDDTVLSDQSLDQVILNYLVEKKDDE